MINGKKKLIKLLPIIPTKKLKLAMEELGENKVLKMKL